MLPQSKPQNRIYKHITLNILCLSATLFWRCLQNFREMYVLFWTGWSMLSDSFVDCNVCQVWEAVRHYHTVNCRDISSRWGGLWVSSELFNEDIKERPETWDTPFNSRVQQHWLTMLISMKIGQFIIWMELKEDHWPWRYKLQVKKVSERWMT